MSKHSQAGRQPEGLMVVTLLLVLAAIFIPNLIARGHGRIALLGIALVVALAGFMALLNLLLNWQEKGGRRGQPVMEATARLPAPWPTNFESQAKVLLNTERGPIIGISFSGEYPAGSAGNDVAAAMRSSVTKAEEEFQPAGVIFDLTNLRYGFGDAICEIAMPLQRLDSSFVPHCVLTQGATAEALAPLMSSKMLLGVAGSQMFADLDQAIDHLKKRLDEELQHLSSHAKVHESPLHGRVLEIAPAGLVASLARRMLEEEVARHQPQHLVINLLGFDAPLGAALIGVLVVGAVAMPKSGGGKVRILATGRTAAELDRVFRLMKLESLFAGPSPDMESALAADAWKAETVN